MGHLPNFMSHTVNDSHNNQITDSLNKIMMQHLQTMGMLLI